MKTAKTDTLPEITWERGEWIERPDDYVNTYITKGFDKDGVEYSGAWIECGGEVEIEDIECETPHPMKLNTGTNQ